MRFPCFDLCNAEVCNKERDKVIWRKYLPFPAKYTSDFFLICWRESRCVYEPSDCYIPWDKLIVESVLTCCTCRKVKKLIATSVLERGQWPLSPNKSRSKNFFLVQWPQHPWWWTILHFWPQFFWSFSHFPQLEMFS